MDANGRPLPTIWRAAHDGAIGLLANGELEAGQTVARYKQPAEPAKAEGGRQVESAWACKRRFRGGFSIELSADTPADPSRGDGLDSQFSAFRL